MVYYLATMADISYDETAMSWPYPRVNSLRTAKLAKTYGLGLEIDEYCTGVGLDEERTETDRIVAEKLTYVKHAVLHAPYNELFPCAIEPKIRQVAYERYEQAVEAALAHGIPRVVIHSGYTPPFYFDSWFLTESARFWKEFLAAHPGDYEICLENIMETDPEILRDLMEAVNDPRLRVCMDFGHAYVKPPRPLSDWIRVLAPYLTHYHLHDNAGCADTHSALGEGTIPLCELLSLAEELTPNAGATLEVMEPEASIAWLIANGFLGRTDSTDFSE